MNKRSFLMSLVALPSILIGLPAQAFWGFFARGLIRQVFRALVRRGARSVVSGVAKSSISRTITRAARPNRIKEVFGSKRHNILDKRGRVIGVARTEGRVLMIRDAQKKVLGYLQAEGEGLAVYDGMGTRLLAFRMKNNRLVAYNKYDDYLGQIIKKTVKDEVESFFIDRFGNAHNTVPVELSEPSQQAEEINFQHARIRENRLELIDDSGKVQLYGLFEGDEIVLYYLLNLKRGAIRREASKMFIYNLHGRLLAQTGSDGPDLVVRLGLLFE